MRKFRHHSVSSYSNEDTAAKSEDKPSLRKFRHNSISSYLKPDRSSKGNDSLSLTLSDWLHQKGKDNTTADEMSMETNEENLDDAMLLKSDEHETHNNTPTKDYLNDISYSSTQGEHVSTV